MPGELGNSAGSWRKAEAEVEGKVWIVHQEKAWAQSARIVEPFVHCSAVDMVEERIAHVVVGCVGSGGPVVEDPARMQVVRSSFFVAQAEDRGRFVVRTVVLRQTGNSQQLP